jgi:hypothetical protein
MYFELRRAEQAARLGANATRVAATHGGHALVKPNVSQVHGRQILNCCMHHVR